MRVTAIDETHDPARRSWVESANGHQHFPIQNLPLGVFSVGQGDAGGGVAIGDQILALGFIAQTGVLEGPALEAARMASAGALNDLLAAGPNPRRALRQSLSALLSDPSNRAAVTPALVPAERATMHLPVRIGDYTDFYVGIHHANNVGKQFRPDNPLLANYKYVPIGYHGRASSVRPSGIGVRRPSGQIRSGEGQPPEVSPTRRLDYELELAVWVGEGNALGQPVPIADADRHIAGLSLLNDWSARDIQAWEYQPLGPFTSKNFMTTVSPWIVTMEALAPFRVQQPPRSPGDPAPLPYLWSEADQAQGAFSITLEVAISSQRMRNEGLEAYPLSRSAASNMYWTVAQMLSHHTLGGCNLQPGDLLGSGTISGPERDGVGSLLELSVGGREPIILPSGERRTFLEDADEITLSATASADGFASIGFGPCTAMVLPALQP